MTVRRFDSSPLQASRTAAGSLRGDARVTRTGVLVYRNADGSTRRELRHPDEVFRADSLASLALVPITLGHPAEEVTSANAKQYAIGAVGDSVRKDGQFVRAPFAIHDDAAIAEVESGAKRALSCGYNCDLDPTPGTYNGERYDAVQRNIVYNHLAVLAKGRAGADVRIDGDDTDAYAIVSETAEARETPESHETRARADGANVIIVKLHGLDFSVDEKVAAALKLHTDGIEAETAKLRTEIAAIKTERDQIKGRADAADETIKALKAETSLEAINRKIAGRVALVTQAKKAGLPSSLVLDGLSDDEIKRAVILHVSPAAKLDGQSVDYVRARFDAAIEGLDEEDGTARADGDDPVKRSRAAFHLAASRADTTDGEEDDSHAKMVERNRNAWRAKA